MKPDCMDDQELALWEAANRSTTGGARATIPCTDCTAAWAEEMGAEGRCNRPPRKVRSDRLPDSERRAKWRAENISRYWANKGYPASPRWSYNARDGVSITPTHETARLPLTPVAVAPSQTNAE